VEPTNELKVRSGGIRNALGWLGVGSDAKAHQERGKP
jgi:hypothetical protein